MRTDARLSHVTVLPGRSTQVDIEVTNTSNVIDGVTVIVDGLDPSWVDLRQPLVRLFPDDTKTVSFQITPPEHARAGNYLVVACVVSTIDAQEQSSHDFWVTVDPVVRAKVRAVPSVITRGASARVDVIATNTGNTRTTWSLNATDQSREVECTVEPRELELEPGESQTAVLTMRGPRPWLGQVVHRAVTVTAAAGAEPPETTLVTFRQRPRVPRGLMTFLILAGIVAVWALIFFLVIKQIRGGDALPKSPATAFPNGEAEVPVAKVGATAKGRVTSVTEGAGVARVTVEAFRIVEGREPALASAGATDEEGVFELAGLLPGDYQFKFSADGFETTWSPKEYTLLAGRTEPGITIDLPGKTAAISGSITVPASAADLQFTVTATLLVDGAATPDPPATPGAISTGGNDIGPVPAELQPAEPGAPADAPRVATFTVPDVPAPATYRLRVEASSEEFAPVVFEVRVDGGQQAQANPVRPAAQPASISGLVVDGSNQPLGDVKVTVRSGDFTVEAVTPTSGDGLVGTFQILGLPTPADYVVTYTKDGYTSATQAFTLEAGKPRTDLGAKLIGGLGTITGSVVDGDVPAGGDANLGDVAVVVQGGGFEGTATSLTAGSPGAFTVSNIPVPGVYTVTFRRDGYESQTVPVTFGEEAGTQQIPQIVMRRTTASIDGTITVGNLQSGTPITDIEIVLDDGRQQRRTRPATDPFGTFSFRDVPKGSYTISFTLGDVVLRVLSYRLEAGQQLQVATAFDLPSTGTTP